MYLQLRIIYKRAEPKLLHWCDSMFEQLSISLQSLQVESDRCMTLQFDDKTWQNIALDSVGERARLVTYLLEKIQHTACSTPTAVQQDSVAIKVHDFKGSSFSVADFSGLPRASSIQDDVLPGCFDESRTKGSKRDRDSEVSVSVDSAFSRDCHSDWSHNSRVSLGNS